ncbi:MAG: SIMPL domain-containing protein [Candidatus Eremiobacteraeota bacterium]|nr:SIMPL domain-containing protein [Candidatus Eremiobacteraeota bacterium]
MKRVFFALLFVIFAVSAPLAADELKQPSIVVYGTATIEIAPDLLIWHLRLCNKGPRMPVVAQENAALTEQVLSYLRRQKIPEANIQTNGMSFGEDWDYNTKIKTKLGYFAETEILFRTNNLESYKALWVDLAENPGVSVEEVCYDHTQRIRYQNESRQKAVLAAREKARYLAETLGCEIGEPLLIEEDLEWQKSASMSNIKTILEDESTLGIAIAIGRIPICTRVKVAFRLLAPGK